MFLGREDITAYEEGVCLWIHHKHSGLISSCFNGRHHFWMLHHVHWNAIHLQKQPNINSYVLKQGETIK